MRYFRRTLWVFILAVGVGGLILRPEARAAEVVDRIVAVVNNDIITLSELDAAFQPYMERIRSLRYSLERERKLLFEAREQVLDQLITRKLTDQQVEKLKIKVSEKEVDAAIERIKAANYYSEEDLREMLQRDGIDYETYRNQIREQILRSQVVNREVKSKIVITLEDVAAYYNAHIDDYKGETKIHLRNIIKRVPPSATTDDKAAIRAQMEDIHAQLTQGADFGELARKHSESPGAAEGGELGEFAETSLAPVIREAVAGLKAGAFTGVIDTDVGYQIFFVDEVRQAGGKSLKEVTPKIQEQLYQQAIDKRFSNWIKELRETSHIKVIL